MFLIDHLHQRGHRRDPRLGAAPLPRRRARPRVLRRHAPLRARGPAPGLPPRLGHADLQLRPQRGQELPALQRRSLARARTTSTGCAWTPSRRCSTSTTRAKAGRVDAERVRRPREPRGDRVPPPAERGRLPGAPGRPDLSRRNPPRGRWCRARPTWAGSASASSGTWAGCTTRLQYLRREPIHRRYHHNELTFRQVYAYSENFVLPLSHDEVVHGKGSLLGKMPGDDWQRFANLRLLFGYQWAQTGQEAPVHGRRVRPAERVGPRREPRLAPARRSFARGRRRAGCATSTRCIAPSRRCTRSTRSPAGSSGSTPRMPRAGTLCFLRRGPAGARRGRGRAATSRRCRTSGFRVGLPDGGVWHEALNSDAEIYGGSGMGNLGRVRRSRRRGTADRTALEIVLPPLSCLFFRPGTDRHGGVPAS